MLSKDLNKDFFIAGGLDITNINQVIDEFNPYGVDLSSGVEVNGLKNEEKIKEIMEAIK